MDLTNDSLESIDNRLMYFHCDVDYVAHSEENKKFVLEQNDKKLYYTIIFFVALNNFVDSIFSFQIKLY